MHQVFKLIIKWLELFPSEYMKYYEVHRKVKKGFLVDRDIAISAAGIELIKIIDHCFNVHERITKATKSINLTEEEEQTSWYFTKKKDKKFKVALSHAFGSQGGFDAIIKFCTSVPLDTIDEKAVPLAYVNALLDSISEIISEFKDHEKKESLLVEIKKIITSQVDNITDDDVEKLEISQLNNLLEKLKHFGSLSENNDKEMEEMMELKL